MSERQLRRLKIIEATIVISFWLLLIFWCVNSEHFLFLFIHASPEKLSQWYPRFGWLIPYWPQIILPFLIGCWTFVVLAKHSLPLRFDSAIAMSWSAFIAFWSVGSEVMLLFLLLLVLMYYLLSGVSSMVDQKKQRLKVAFHIFRQSSYKRVLGSLAQLEHGWSLGILAVLILLAVGFRFWLVMISDIGSYFDASTRLVISHLLSDHYFPTTNFLYILNPSPDWLPLHFYCNAFLIGLGCKTVHLRLFHALAGVYAALVLFRLSKEFMSSRSSALAALAYLVYPTGCLVSIQILSEPLFLVTTLSALNAFLVFFRTRQSKRLIECSIWLLAGSLLRFEGWILLCTFILLYLKFFRPLRGKELLQLLLPVSGPILIMLILIQQGHHPLRGILYSDFEVATTLAEKGNFFALALRDYSRGWVFMSLTSAIVFGFMFRHSRKHLMYFVFLWLLALPFILKNLRHEILPQSRYLLLYMPFFFIPILMVLKRWILNVFGRNPLSSIGYVFLVLSCSLFSLFFETLEVRRFPDGFTESLNKVSEIKEGEFLVDFHKEWLTYNWIVESGLPFKIEHIPDSLGQVVDFASLNESAPATALRSITYMVTYHNYAFGNLDSTNLQMALNKKGSEKYLILFQSSPLDQHFQFRAAIEEYKGRKYKKEFENNGFRIYHQLSYETRIVCPEGSHLP